MRSALAVDLLEDCPLFNAGHGAVFTHDETHELDAAVMDGATLSAGAVGCVTRIKRPVRAARAVMEQTDHVLLVGAGAEALARAAGPGDGVARRTSPPSTGASSCTARSPPTRPCSTTTAPRSRSGSRPAPTPPLDEQRKFGTVGAVALDAHGHLAAATSTGGMTNKRPAASAIRR